MNAVEAHNIVKTFGDVVALDGVSVSFEEGIVYGLLGPNGAGKTTLIRVLTTLLKPDSGMARVVDIDVVADPAGVRHKIGLAGQFAAVDDFLTGRENVEMVGRLYNLSKTDAARRAEEVLERIRLIDAADRPVRTYSGGMRRRLDLAASMVGRPEVLFLDEPTTGIDPGSRLDLWDLIDELVDTGTTLLLTTQYLDEADRLADRIGVIDRGHLIDEGTSDELKDRLGGNVVEVHVTGDDRASAAGALTAVSGGELMTEGQALVIPAVNGARTLTAAVRALDDAGIEPQDIGLRRPTLDDVFLTLTGHRAAEGEDAEAEDPGPLRGERV
ncbi:MAG TPA: ATP-binding cassette domain-containing protein [Acidimicrobiia bacterium]|nr:ATP-binding cassette domain-containing protein [Acidimicrobiia bacterium]